MKIGYSNSTHKTPRHQIYGRTYIEVWSLKAWWKQDAKKPAAKAEKPKKRKSA